MAIKNLKDMQGKLFESFESVASVLGQITYANGTVAEKAAAREATVGTMKELVQTILEVEREMAALDAFKEARERGDSIFVETGGATERGVPTMSAIKFKPKA